MGKLIFWYLIVINALAYGVYWLDKRRAEKGKGRISERELLLWAGAGGSVGAVLAMRRHRHKTKKLSFKLMFLAVVLLQIGVIWYLVKPG